MRNVVNCSMRMAELPPYSLPVEGRKRICAAAVREAVVLRAGATGLLTETGCVRRDSMYLGRTGEEMVTSTRLIREDGSFCEESCEELLRSQEMLQDVTAPRENFNIVSIIGPQSSGKSTLLNEVFGTEFTTMDASVGRYQVTRGIWGSVAAIEGKKVLVFDVEGSDSSERGADGQAVERKLALFALVLSDVLIVNLWCTDVGRRNASTVALLRCIIQLQFQVFGGDEESRKRPLKLLFVLRDYDGQTPTEKIEGHLRRQVKDIFDDICGSPGQKGTEEASGSVPAHAKCVSINDLIQQDFMFLPHRTFCSAEFTATARVLKQWLVIPHSYRRGVPAQDLAHFAASMWETIRQDERLNIPNQKQLLALFRCGRASDRVRTLAMESLRTMNTIVDSGGRIEGLLSQRDHPGGPVQTPFQTATTLIEDALIEFNLEVYGHSEDVVTKKAAELSAELLPCALDAFKTSVRSFRRQALEGLQQEMNQLTENSAPWEAFADFSTNLRSSWLDRFQDALAVDDSSIYDEWREAVTRSRDNLARDIDLTLIVARERVLRSYQRELERQMLEAVGPPLEALVATGDLDLWERATILCRAKWEDIRREAPETLQKIGVTDVAAQEKSISKKLRHAVVERAQTMIGSNTAFFHRLSSTFRDALPDNWASQCNSNMLLADARGKALEQLLLFSVVRIDGFDGTREPAIEHFTNIERDSLLTDLERLESDFIRTVRAEQYQRNIRITEAVLSTATVIGLAVATTAFGTSRRN